MEAITALVENLKRRGIKTTVDARIREFGDAGKKPSRDVFKELCFCLLTANFNAERSVVMQEKIGDGFLNLPEGELAEKLRVLGHRFPEARARYITEARKHKDTLKETMKSFGNENELREWLVRSIKGLGYKEASHFLRNIGYNNLAIIDFHIMDTLARHGLMEKPRTLTKSKYLEAEKILRDLAGKVNLSLAELDLYLWYSETGKVLK